MKPKTCDTCGEPFIPSSGRQERCPACAKTRALKYQCAYRQAARARKKKPVSCRDCRVLFTPKRVGATLCPDCLIRVSTVEAEEKLVTEPGPCSSCRSQDSDRRGIARCRQLGGMRCSEANPGHDCRLRMPEDVEAEPEVNVTDTLIRKGNRMIHRTDAEIAALMVLRGKRRRT